MKNKGLTITLIVFLGLLVISLSTFMILAMNNKFNYTFNINTKTSINKKIFDKEYDSNINEVILDLKDSDVEIRKNSSDKIRVVYYNNNKNKNIEVINSDNNIRINDVNNDVCFGFCYFNKRIVLYIPDTYNSNININSVSSDITFYDSFNVKINIKTTSGDITGKDFRELSINTVSGDIQFDKVLERSSIKTTSGDIEAGDINKSTIIKTVSGEIDINRLNIEKESKINTTSGDVEINSINDIFVETSTVSGDVSIKNNNRKSDIVLKINTTSGDIDIN